MKKCLWLILFCGSSFAAPIPTITIDHVTYTNVEIGSVSGSRVSLYFDGGGKMFAISNLPPEIRSKIDYDPAKEAALEAKRTLARAAVQRQLQASESARANLGPAQKVRLIKVISDTQIQIVGDSGILTTAYIHNLPPEVLAFVKDLNRTEGIVNSTRFNSETEVYRQTKGRMSAPTGYLTDAAATVKNDRIHLAELLDKEKHGANIVMASPSKYMLYQGVFQWEFMGLPATFSRTSHTVPVVTGFTP